MTFDSILQTVGEAELAGRDVSDAGWRRLSAPGHRRRNEGLRASPCSMDATLAKVLKGRPVLNTPANAWGGTSTKTTCRPAPS
jgi:hypothetical protein